LNLFSQTFIFLTTHYSFFAEQLPFQALSQIYSKEAA
jgi:hypothetical protein